MAMYLIVAEICESAFSPSLTYSAIQNAFRSAVLSGWGTLIGPGPRIVRGRFQGCNLGTATKAAWLVDMPFTEDAIRAAQTEIQMRLMRELDAISNPDGESGETPWWWSIPAVYVAPLAVPAWPLVVSAYALSTFARSPGHWDAAFVPFTAGASGELEWWRSGQAINTRTRDTPDFGPRENVLGPDTLLPEQINLIDRARQTQSEIFGNVTKVALAIAALIAVVYLVPVLARWLSARSAIAPRGPLPPGLPPPRPRVVPPPAPPRPRLGANMPVRR